MKVYAGLKLSFNRKGHAVWSWSNGSVAFEHIGWSDKRNDDRSERRQHGLESEGHRLAASLETIYDCMVRTGMDLIVSIKSCRQEERRDDYQKTDKEERTSHTAKIVLLRSNGDIETCDGRSGTWKAPRHRALTRGKPRYARQMARPPCGRAHLSCGKGATTEREKGSRKSCS
jgi:hypothetical protein